MAGTRLVDAAHRVFRRHFDRLVANEPGTRVGEDPEALHDMRVATRRLRAALRTFREAVPPSRVRRFRAELRWLASTLGEVRDLEVHIGNLDAYAGDLSDKDRAALSPFRAHLATRRGRARVRLLRALDSRRYSRFLAGFRTFLDRGPPRRPSLPSARAPAAEAAIPLVRQAYENVLEVGRTLDPRTPRARGLHRLRIAGKRLRYTVEAFLDLLGARGKRFVEHLVALQDLLGAHQDAVVAAREARTFSSRKPSTALDRLVCREEAAAEHARGVFRGEWRSFRRRKPPA